MLAITLIWLLQRSQTSMSILNTRLSRCIHVIPRWRSSRLLSRQSLSAGSTFSGCLLATFGGRYLNTVLAIRRKDTVETGEIDSWPGRQSGRPGNKVQRFKEDMGGAVRVRGFQLVSSLSMDRYRQMLL